MALLSGLDLGSGSDKLILVQEMVYAITGKSGNSEMQKMMSQISRVIIAGMEFSWKNSKLFDLILLLSDKTSGNSLSSATQDRDVLDKARYLLQNNMATSAEAIHLLDDFLFQLAVQLLEVSCLLFLMF